MLNGAFAAGQLATGRDVENHFTQRATRLAFVGFQLVKAVQRLFGGLDRLTHFPVVIAAFDVQLSQEADGFHRASIIQRIDSFLNDLLVLTLIQLALFTAANKQNALRQNVRHMVQQ